MHAVKGSSNSDVLELRIEKDVSSFSAGKAIVDQQPFYNFLAVLSSEVIKLT
jgi:hypothetical protein